MPLNVKDSLPLPYINRSATVLTEPLIRLANNELVPRRLGHVPSILGNTDLASAPELDALYTFNPTNLLNVGDIWSTISRNVALWSEDITKTAYTATNVTKVSPTQITFTAQNGILAQDLATLDSQNYTLSFKVQNVDGNTSLNFVHTGSASGDTTPLVIDGSLIRYKVSVLGAAGGGTVSFGIQDPNASGFGTITITEIQIEPGTTLSSYEKTEDRQQIHDWSDKGNFGQRGTTPNIDVNDTGDYFTGTDKLIALGNFDGTDDSIEIPNSSSLQFSSGMTTISLFRQNAAGLETLVAKSGSYEVRQNVSERATFLVTGLTVASINTVASMASGSWHVLTTVYDGVDLKLFINSALDNSTPATGTIAVNTNLVTIGRRTGNWNGQMALVAMYDIGLTNTQVSNFYNQIKTEFAAPRGITLP